ncbi:hypothetical protein [Fodinibius sp. Rm-B-1B1-1]|uniref:hypothetical protein n=1 Tax=Fodinibius alkaliphilus TaxID=3140241 RepID=UPI00315A306F
MSTFKSKPVSYYLLLAFLVFQGISGLFGGGALIWNPTGSALQMPISLLEGSLFSDYLIPGIILFTILGIFPLIVCLGLWQRKLWGWWGALLVSMALIIWIGVEIAMVGYHSDPPLQLIYGLLAIGLFIIVQLPAIRFLFEPNFRRDGTPN